MKIAKIVYRILAKLQSFVIQWMPEQNGLTYDTQALTELALEHAVRTGKIASADELDAFWHPSELAGMNTSLTLVKK